MYFLVPSPVSAAQLQSRSLRIGSSTASAITQHSVQFNLATNATLGSIQLQYCTSPLFSLPCVAPSGLDASGAILSAQNGQVGFSIVSATTNTIVIGRPLALPASPGTVSYTFDHVVNPDGTVATSYARITTYSSTDASGAWTDFGSVAFSVARGLGVGVFVPPYLTFCVGVSVSPDCSSMTGNFIDLGQLSPQNAKTATSQFATATNDVTGYVVSIHGTTMTSGNNVLPASAVPAASTPGVAQFGINLRANGNPLVGQEPSGIGTGVADPTYNVPNQFAFVPDSNLASSPISSDFTLFTVSYIANVTSNQAPGFYSATTTFIATAAF